MQRSSSRRPPPPPPSAARPLSFVSSNRHKYGEAEAALGSLGIRTNHIMSDLLEVQSDSLARIAQAKARDAFSKFGVPVIVEDDGLFIDALDGFPGPYASYVLKKIGTRGILDLLCHRGGRRARFVSAIAYDDGREHRVFEASVRGAISDSACGRGWGYDPIFVPDGSGRTFAEMPAQEKVAISHRTRALGEFAKWYVR